MTPTFTRFTVAWHSADGRHAKQVIVLNDAVDSAAIGAKRYLERCTGSPITIEWCVETSVS